jgi:hypothetical protein
MVNGNLSRRAVTKQRRRKGCKIAQYQCSGQTRAGTTTDRGAGLAEAEAAHGQDRNVIAIQNEGKLGIVSVFGEFELADYKRFEEEVTRQLQAQGRVNLLVDLRDMVDYTVDVALEDIRFTRAHARERGRIAILSERETVRWIALLSQLFLDSDIQVFGEEPAAREWLAQEQGA